MNLGVPKYMVVWKRNQRFGAKTCVMVIMMIVAAEKYPYRKRKKKRKKEKRKKEKRKKEKRKKEKKRKKNN